MLTDAELLLLGLVSEMPRHGYELEQVIEQRGMREWTQIGFSSIYFVLGKIEKSGLVETKASTGAKARKVFSVTSKGHAALLAQTVQALSRTRPTYSSALLGMAHWPILPRETALAALTARIVDIERETTRLESVRFQRQPLPDFVEALFDFSVGQLSAEKTWATGFLHIMKDKP
jgi:DNA-binding PadR family transcriptional regulator